MHPASRASVEQIGNSAMKYRIVLLQLRSLQRFSKVIISRTKDAINSMLKREDNESK
jgi:hypothetical protein